MYKPEKLREKVFKMHPTKTTALIFPRTKSSNPSIQGIKLLEEQLEEGEGSFKGVFYRTDVPAYVRRHSLRAVSMAHRGLEDRILQLFMGREKTLERIGAILKNDHRGPL